MTSNIGGRYLADPELSEAFARDAAEDELKAHFRPEFLNRLDEVIYFHLLTETHLRQILELLLKKEEQLLAGQELQLQLTEAAKSWLLAQNEHPEWGARPLRRIIQKHIREPIADFILTEELQPGTTINIKIKGKKLSFEIES
jgi:ATP-dependent Clp protease ATP-binding subunit ClpA